MFQYNEVNVCHACGTGYRERVAFDFDALGRYVGTRPAGICKSSDASLDLPGVAACPATSP